MSVWMDAVIAWSSLTSLEMVLAGAMYWEYESSKGRERRCNRSLGRRERATKIANYDSRQHT